MEARLRTIADEYAEGLHVMSLFHSPAVLRRAAEEVIEHLPDEPVSIVSTSMEGAALAAVCSVLAGDRIHAWHFLNMALPPDPSVKGAVVVVEPVDPGEGWRRMLLARLPKASVVIPAPGERR